MNFNKNPSEWGEAERKEALKFYSQFSLKDLRKRQTFLFKQQHIVTNELSMANLQVIEKLLAEAVDLVAFRKVGE